MREYRTSQERRETSADRRTELRNAGKCINGPLIGDVGCHGVVHGPVVRAGRCQGCLDVKALTS